MPDDPADALDDLPEWERTSVPLPAVVPFVPTEEEEAREQVGGPPYPCLSPSPCFSPSPRPRSGRSA